MNGEAPENISEADGLILLKNTAAVGHPEAISALKTMKGSSEGSDESY